MTMMMKIKNSSWSREKRAPNKQLSKRNNIDNRCIDILCSSDVYSLLFHKEFWLIQDSL